MRSLVNPILRGKLIVENASNKKNACVFMSFGKDSLVTLDLVVRFGNFEKIYMCYLCFAKEMTHLKPYVEAVKRRYPDKEIIYIEQYHFDYYVYKKHGVFCDPAKTKMYRIAEIEKAINVEQKEDLNFFWGWKMSDSPARAMTLNTYDAQGCLYKSNRFFPITRFTHTSVLKYLQQRKLPKPIAYGKKNGKMNGFGLNKETFRWLKKQYPQDLTILQKEFPYFIF